MWKSYHKPQENQDYRTLLPLKNLFRNKKIEINIDLNELKNLFEALKLFRATIAIAI